MKIPPPEENPKSAPVCHNKTVKISNLTFNGESINAVFLQGSAKYYMGFHI